MKKHFTVILSNPEKEENIGLVARNMKNTGFEKLRIVKVSQLKEKSYVTAVHAQEILDNAQFFSDIKEAAQDLDCVFASTSKIRKNFSVLPLKEAVLKMFSFPPPTKIGLIFGNERTGLTSEELLYSNFRFSIPQAGKQPSYNLASAVLLTLFHISMHGSLEDFRPSLEKPLSRNDQEECIHLILKKLEKEKFIHKTNKRHMTELVFDLFGRLTMTEKDRKLLMAIFSKGIR